MKRLRKGRILGFSLIIIVIIILLIVLIPKNNDTATIKIGAILPMTGSLARYGELEKAGIEMALEEINNEGINGKKLNIIYEDSQGQQTQAINAWRKITLDKNIPIIINTISSICQTLSPLANEEHIVIMSSDCAVASYSSPNDYTFRILSSNAKEGSQMADYLISKGIKTISILKTNNDYGEGLIKAFTKDYTDKGGKIDVIESYNSDQRDFKTELNKIKYSESNAIYLMSYAPDAEIILKQIKELGINLPIYAGEPFENNNILKNIPQEAEGVIYLRPEINTEPGLKLMEKYKAKVGNNPEINVARTYDALKIIAKVIKICDKDKNLNSECIKNELYKVKDYEGTFGVISFNEMGDVDVPYSIKTVKNGEFVKYESK